jgi:predicted heme/steroid binding protein
MEVSILLTNQEYVKKSLELNLFFLRIAKEHTIFAAASLPPRDKAVAQQLLDFKKRFETLLGRVIDLSSGIIGPEVKTSGELVTEFTLQAEEKTQNLTGIPIDMSLTQRELSLTSQMRFSANMRISEKEPADNSVSRINKEALSLMNAALDLKKTLLNNVLNCKAFSYTYPLMLDHVIREGLLYVMLLNRLENKEKVDSSRELIEFELNWNRIMGEHSKFIRGYLDPSEEVLFETANSFAKEFDSLMARTMDLPKQPSLLPQITRESSNRVVKLRAFKVQGLKGILACKIKSVIPPLLADHVTREANHYLRLLDSLDKPRETFYLENKYDLNRYHEYISQSHYRNEKEITLSELADYDGKDGKPAYIAVNGVVYDVSKESTWNLNINWELPSGRDLTIQFQGDREKSKMLNLLSKVGILKNEMTLDELAKFDGKDGKPSYIAVGGIVYDVSKESTFDLDIKWELPGGRDLTIEFQSNREMSKLLGLLSKIGVIK